jgi:hypothetical protein
MWVIALFGHSGNIFWYNELIFICWIQIFMVFVTKFSAACITYVTRKVMSNQISTNISLSIYPRKLIDTKINETTVIKRYG